MYMIVKDSIIISLCDAPRYIKLSDSGSWIQCDKETAEKIAVSDKNYNLNEVNVREIDGSEFTFDESLKLAIAETNIVDTQDALCEASDDFEQRLSDIENALCDLSMEEV